MSAFIRLLSGKPLRDFSAEEFKEHVRGLFFKREPRKAAPKVKKQRDFKVRIKLTKKKKLTVTTKRKDPKYVTQEEFEAALEDTGLRANDLFIALSECGVIVSGHREAERIAEELRGEK